MTVKPATEVDEDVMDPADCHHQPCPPEPVPPTGPTTSTDPTPPPCLHQPCAPMAAPPEDAE